MEVRFVAATNRDLKAMMIEKHFRGDLYYRLNVFPIEVPPLRDRREDIPLLVGHFVQHFARRMNRTIEAIRAEAMDTLTDYDWPGNVRELQNLMERAVILSPGPVLQVPLRYLHARAASGQGNGRNQSLEAEREQILANLKEAKGVLSGPKGAATRLGMKRTTLYYCMKKLGIVRSTDL
jgi:formate hydrogenlyase transcriptional activator